MPGSSEGLTMSLFEQIKITAVKLSRYKTQVTGHCFTNAEKTLSVHEC